MHVIDDLRRASRGRYRSAWRRRPLTLDRTFAVVDHDNAGERRSADTLSGGETFLASLALALGAVGTGAARGGRGVARQSLWRLPPGMTCGEPGQEPWLRYPAVSFVVAARPFVPARPGSAREATDGVKSEVK
jgi:hypothetical protein